MCPASGGTTTPRDGGEVDRGGGGVLKKIREHKGARNSLDSLESRKSRRQVNLVTERGVKTRGLGDGVSLQEVGFTAPARKFVQFGETSSRENRCGWANLDHWEPSGGH